MFKIGLALKMQIVSVTEALFTSSKMIFEFIYAKFVVYLSLATGRSLRIGKFQLLQHYCHPCFEPESINTRMEIFVFESFANPKPERRECDYRQQNRSDMLYQSADIVSLMQRYFAANYAKQSTILGLLVRQLLSVACHCRFAASNQRG